MEGGTRFAAAFFSANGNVYAGHLAINPTGHDAVSNERMLSLCGDVHACSPYRWLYKNVFKRVRRIMGKNSFPVNLKEKDFMPLGERLREERKRLNLTQPEFASIAGTSKQTLFSWETGKTSPDAQQMAALAAAGVDVLYVLTGNRSPASLGLSEREAKLLDNYRALAEEDRAAIQRWSHALAESFGTLKKNA